ncbi:unnamed protein product [Fraxinus pennsylvanica]|uniref:Dehydrin n=1 Tax=Fraxinus pennsylvanica TaxID=56036 RepID=A0AAD1YVC1_9LAMI|nr:unnamed protein product [Fraxinus pennsylvanica]
MSEEVKQHQQNVDEPCVHKATAVNVAEEGGVDSKDRGLFHFTGKKEEEKKAEEEGIVNEFEPKVQVCEPKKGLKEKVSGEHKEEHKTQKISVPVEKCEESEEKKGFVGKIKEKIPGGHKKAEEVAVPPPPYQATECTTPDAEAKEKKGLLDKIKEKIPGYNPKTEEEKEKEKV